MQSNNMSVTLQVGNMKEPQNFSLCQYKGGIAIELQSEKRYIVANLKTGEGEINCRNKNYATHVDLMVKPIAIKLPEETRQEIYDYLLNNDGKDGNINGVIFFKIEKLFSKLIS